MGAAVLFRGKDAILRAYEYNQIVSWAIFVQGKIFTFCPEDVRTIEEGEQRLSDVLDMLMQGCVTTAQLELRCYVDPRYPITQNSPFSSAVGFKLTDPEDAIVERGMGAILTKMSERMDSLEARQKQRDEEPADEPEIPAWQRTIGAIVERPEVMQYLMGKVIGFVESIFPTKRPAAAVGSIPPAPADQQSAENLYAGLDATQRALLDEAMPVLMSKDPNVGTNLSKIAKLLVSDPDKYRMFAAMLT